MNRSTNVGVLMALLLVAWAPSLSAQSLYFSNEPNACAMESSTTIYHIYAYSPDDADFAGASFSLVLDFYAPGDLVSVTPVPGVTIEGMDVSAYPMTFSLSWTPDALGHRPLVALQYAFVPLTGGLAKVNDIVMRRPGGSEVVGIGKWSITGSANCSCSFHWELPAVVQVAVGQTTVLPFRWAGYCFSNFGGPLTVSDERGWVQAWTPPAVEAGNSCTWCYLDWYDGTVTVNVPEETPAGTESQVMLYAIPGFTGTFRVRAAAAPNPVEATTWGAVKALYEREE